MGGMGRICLDFRLGLYRRKRDLHPIRHAKEASCFELGCE